MPESLFNIDVAGTCSFIKNETLAQVFSCEFCEIFKNTFFIEQLSWLLLFLNSDLLITYLVFYI